MAEVAPDQPHRPPEESAYLATRRALLTVLAALATGILLALTLFYRIGGNDARNQAFSQLEAVLNAKAHALVVWRQELLDDAAILQDRALVQVGIEPALTGRATARQREETRSALVRYANRRNFKAILLLDAKGQTILSTTDEAKVHPDDIIPSTQIGVFGAARITEFHVDSDGEPVIDVVAPLESPGSRPLGYIVMRLALRMTAHSIVSPWPGNSGSSEALLLSGRRESPLLLTPRRLVAGDVADPSPHALDDPLSRQAGAVTAIERMEGTDYRGKQVLAVARPLDGASWVLLAKVDHGEALAGLRRQTLHLLVGSLFLYGLAALAVVRLWKIQTARDRSRLAEEVGRRKVLRELEQRLSEAQEFGRLGSWERNLRTGEVWWSDGMYALTGQPREADANHGEPLAVEAGALHPTLLRFVHAADRERFIAATSEELHVGERGSVEFRIVTTAGDIRHVHHQWSTVNDADGKPLTRRGITQDISERVRADASQREQLDMLKTLIDNVPGGVTLFDADLRLRFHNPQYKVLLDFPDDLFKDPAPAFEVFARYNAWRGEYGPGDPEAQTAAAIQQAREPTLRVFERERPGGAAIEVRDAPLKGGGFVTIYTDITARKQAEQRLRLSDKIIASSPSAILITNPRNQIVFVNPAFTAITGFTLKDVIGKNPKVFASGRHDAQFYRDFWQSIEDTDHWAGEVWDRRQDGSIYPKWLSVHVLRNEAGRLTNYVGMFTDITERKQAEQRIHHLAHHDPLTGLSNRMALEARFDQALADARRRTRQLALIFIDLDRFKTINDSLGHQVGDLLLMEVAGRLTERLRDSDVVARLGGDEFVVVLPEIPDGTHAALVAQTLLDELARPIRVPGHELHTSGSIGIAIYPGDGDTVDALMRAADTAMYEAKAAGRNQLRFFATAMSVSAQDRLQLENSLRTALIERQFEVHYQPQVTPIDGRIVGFEALLRWAHPGHGIVGPDRFVPLAEETGLIVDIGAWVLKEACRQGRRWHDAGYPVRISVNLSTRQLRASELVELIACVLAESGLPAGSLELEVTESAVMERPKEAVALLRAIRGLGVSLALDDFGTGYSSLSYLKLFPLDRLKIDRSFVCDLDTDADDRTIALSTIALAHSLGLKVIAEGVETVSQRDFLHANGCEEAQGWLYGEAMPAPCFAAALAHGTLP